MPSPIGHTLAGCAVALALIPPGMPQAWEAWAVCLISANLPDTDFIPGLLVGNPRAIHRGPSHTIIAALHRGSYWSVAVDMVSVALVAAGWADFPGVRVPRGPRLLDSRSRTDDRLAALASTISGAATVVSGNNFQKDRPPCRDERRVLVSSAGDRTRDFALEPRGRHRWRLSGSFHR